MTDQSLPDSQLAHITRGYTADRDLLNQLIGQIQVSEAYAKMLTCQQLLALHQIKKDKLYKNLGDQQFIAASGESLTVSTWADFCTLIGRSYQHVDEQLRELKFFGEETLTSLRRIGLGHRDLRKLSAFDDADRDVVIQEVETNIGDKEAIVDLIDDLAAKHQREKAALEQKLESAAADLEARDQIAEDKSAKIDQLAVELQKTRGRSQPWPNRVLAIAAQITEQHGTAVQAICRMDELRDAILNEPFDDDVNEEAFAHLGRVYYDAVAQLAESVAPLIDACEAVFSGYYESRQPAAALFEQLRDAHPELFDDAQGAEG